MLGDADAVAVGHLGDGDAALDRRLQVGVVGADAGGDHELEVRRLGEALGGHVRRPEGLADDDVGGGQLALEVGVRAVLVGGDGQLVAALLEELAQAELAGDAAQQLAGREVDRLGSRRREAAGVVVDRGNVVARVGGRIAVDRIVVQDAENVGHFAGRDPNGCTARSTPVPARGATLDSAAWRTSRSPCTTRRGRVASTRPTLGFDAGPSRLAEDGVLLLSNAEGFSLALGETDERISLPAFLHFGFGGLESPEAVRSFGARLAAEGVEIVESWDEPDYVSVKCRDPDGYVVEASWEPG